MAGKIKLPVGIEDFKEIRTMGYYYIDKTGMIRDLLENMGKVTLFTRPRRFGKTLNMSMLKYFFESGNDRSIFDELEIAKEKELYDKYSGKYPVIFISLKSVSGTDFEEAKDMLRSMIGNEALRFQNLLQSDNLSETERQQYEKLIALNDKGEFAMTDSLMKNSLLMLSRFLQKHYGEKTVLLIDEYDVPLDKAYQAGYYDAMTELIRALFGQVLKTNESLHFAVLTGCLRISKESIFTGLNNFNVYTVQDAQYSRYFGFTDSEVRELLGYYGFMDKYTVVKEWYDGYQFGSQEIYCPWDVISYCHALKMDSSVKAKNYWVNTSKNDIIRRFIHRANTVTRSEIELLVGGECIRKKLKQELTYRDLDAKLDNLWSLLYTTGYLTQCGEADDDNVVELVIPNREIRWIFTEQIREWFEEETARDSQKLERFCRAFQENDAAAIETGFTSYLRKTISIRDNHVKKDMKENFYHGILLGLLGHMDGWEIRSNAGSGDGYSDISIEIEDGMKTIYRYGIACYKKRCRVAAG